MPTDATFLLAAIIIVATAIGFAFKVYSDRDRDPPPRISADYIRGLNLVLSRKTDEALELFVQMAKVDDETLETHFALGHLFRRRGEVERAIRVHQNLLARPNLERDASAIRPSFRSPRTTSARACYDRAEQLFAELDDSPTLAEAALEKLVYIYEREREWQKAIDAHRKLEMLSGTKSNQVAHYYCELADAARASGDRELARSYLKNTIRSETGQLRGALIRARHRAGGARYHAGDRALRAGHREGADIHHRGAAAARRVLPNDRQAAVSRREDRELGRPRIRASAAISRTPRSSPISRPPTHSTRASRASFSATRCSRAS